MLKYLTIFFSLFAIIIIVAAFIGKVTFGYGLGDIFYLIGIGFFTFLMSAISIYSRNNKKYITILNLNDME